MFVSTGLVGPVEQSRILKECVAQNVVRISSLLFVNVMIQGVCTFIFPNTKLKRKFQDKKLVVDIDLRKNICYDLYHNFSQRMIQMPEYLATVFISDAKGKKTVKINAPSYSDAEKEALSMITKKGKILKLERVGDFHGTVSSNK